MTRTALLRIYGLTLLYFSANALLNVYIPLKAASEGAGNSLIGIIMGAYLLTTMLLRRWAGDAISKYGPAAVLRTILLLNGFALLVYPFSGSEGYIAARALQGACTAFFSMSIQIGLVDALPDKERSRGIAMYSLCSYLPGVFGPLLAIAIWRSEDAVSFASAMIVISVLTGIAGFGIPIGRTGERSASRPAPPRAKGAFVRFVRDRRLRRCGVLMLIASLVFGAVTTFVPLYADRIANGRAEIYLMLQAGTVVAARFGLRSRIPSDGRWRSAYVSGIMAAAAAAAQCIAFAASGGAAFFYAGAICMGFSQALLYPMLMTYISFAASGDHRNASIGLFIASADLGVALGAIVMGQLADVWSYAWIFTGCACMSAWMAIFAYQRRERD